MRQKRAMVSIRIEMHGDVTKMLLIVSLYFDSVPILGLRGTELVLRSLLLHQEPEGEKTGCFGLQGTLGHHGIPPHKGEAKIPLNNGS